MEVLQKLQLIFCRLEQQEQNESFHILLRRCMNYCKIRYSYFRSTARRLQNFERKLNEDVNLLLIYLKSFFSIKYVVDILKCPSTYCFPTNSNSTGKICRSCGYFYQKQFNKSGSFFFIKYWVVPTNIVLTFVNANFTSDNIYFCNILKIFSTVIVTTRFIALQIDDDVAVPRKIAFRT